MSTRTFEFHPFSSLAFHVQHLHLELLGAEGTQISLYLQQQWHSQLGFHRSLSGSEEFQITDQCSRLMKTSKRGTVAHMLWF